MDFEAQLRQLYREKGMNTHFTSDLDQDVERMKSMPAETFLVVASETSSDAIPVSLHDEAKRFIRTVLEHRVKNQPNVCIWVVKPAGNSIREMKPSDALRWLEGYKPDYKLDGEALIHRGVRIGSLRLRKEINAMRGGQITVHWRYESEISGGDRSDGWLTMFVACVKQSYGAFVIIRKECDLAVAA